MLNVADGQTADVAPAARVRWQLRHHPWLLAALPLVPILTFVFYWHFHLYTDPDFWWHVRTGQYIYETQTLPRVDMYSYTMAGQPWITHEWLSELLLYFLYRNFGYVGDVAFFAALGVLSWLCVYATTRRRGVGEFGAAILALWAFAMTIPVLNVRPQAMTTLLVALTALLLTRYKQGETKVLWLLPLVQAVWVNLHGGFVMGLALLGLTIVGEASARLTRRPAAPLRPLLIVAALTAGATLLNPHGVEALRYPFSYAGTTNASMRFIMEWQSIDFHDPLFLIFGASVLLAVVLGVARRPVGTTEVLWLLTVTVMALQSARHIPVYAVVASPLLGARLQAEIPLLRRSLATWRQPALIAATWPVVALIVLAPVVAPERRAGLQLGWEPSSMQYPAGAVEYLRGHEVEGNLFNDYDWGGYLIYNLYPERKVFIDGRADVYGDEFVEKYDQATSQLRNWRELMQEYDVGLVLVKKGSLLAAVLGEDKGWQEVYVGQVERLFVRREIAGQVSP